MKMILQMLKKVRLILTLIPLNFMYQHANAQLVLVGNSYVQNFNDLSNGLPLGWSVDTGISNTTTGNDVGSTFFFQAPATNTGWSNATGRFKNVASGNGFPNFANVTPAMQLADTNRALGIRQTATFDARCGFVLKLANTSGLFNLNLSFNLQSLDSTSARVSTWQIDYGVGANPAIFTIANATGVLTTGGSSFTKNTVTVHFGSTLDNQTGPVYIRIWAPAASAGSSGSRATTAIDDYTLTWTGTGLAANIEPITKTPMGSGVPLGTNQLQLKFDNLIDADTGTISVYQSGNTASPQIFSIPSAAVVITDSTATINGVSLANNTGYYVLMTAGTFVKQGGAIPSAAITDSTYWTFSTIDTTTPLLPVAASALNETFDHCINTSLGSFSEYNTTGTKTWHCSVSGHNDSAAVYMNGGSAAGVSEANMDWLISSVPFDFSAMNQPMLSFWQKRKYEGNVLREVKISTDYISGSNPANATWTMLQAQDLSVSPGLDIWSQVKDIDLSAYKVMPFFLAFTYSCGVTGAYELTYDDIRVDEETTVGVFTPANENRPLKVLGEATATHINLEIGLSENTDLDIRIYDMTGRTVCKQIQKGKAGNQIYSVDHINIPPGMYIIRVFNGSSYSTAKVFVR